MVEFEWYSSYAMKAFGNDNDTMIFQTLAELEATEDMIKSMESDLGPGDLDEGIEYPLSKIKGCNEEKCNHRSWFPHSTRI